MTLSRLYQNNEMAAISACGIGPAYILRAVLSLAFLFSIIVGIFSFQVLPWANTLQQRIVVDSENATDLEGMTAGRFKEMSSGVGVMYVEDFKNEHTEMQNIFLQQNQKNRVETIIRAESGRQSIDERTGDRFIILENGVRFEGHPERADYTIIEFERYGVRIREKSSANIQKKHTTLPTLELLKSKNTVYRAELHSRLAPVFLCLLLSALAIPLSKTSPRQGRYIRLGFGLVIYIIFTNLINIGTSWIINAKVPLYLGLWWVYILLLMLVIFLFMQQTGMRYLFNRGKAA